MLERPSNALREANRVLWVILLLTDLQRLSRGDDELNQTQTVVRTIIGVEHQIRQEVCLQELSYFLADLRIRYKKMV